jgi:hypothetical protein
MADGEGEKKHKRGSSKEKFCAIPGQPCDCPNNYRDNCKPPDNWKPEFDFTRKIWRALKTYTFDKTYEAHHLLCVSSVSTTLVENDNIDSIIRETEWCINNKDNMFGMPLWGHTVKYYCGIGSAAADIEPAAPPFANIPQHDWDHNSALGYTQEVTKAMKGLAGKIEKSEHDFKGNALQGKLNTIAQRYMTILKNRGSSRNGGTHNAWLQGRKDPDLRWYEPFSMASTGNLTAKGFPVRDFNEKVIAWIDRLASAISGGG